MMTSSNSRSSTLQQKQWIIEKLFDSSKENINESEQQSQTHNYVLIGAEKSCRIVNENKGVEEIFEETYERKRNLSAADTRIPERNMDERRNTSRRTTRKTETTREKADNNN